jgi:hypothetical protein
MSDETYPEGKPLNAEINRRLIMALGDATMRAIAAETQRDLLLADLKKMNARGEAGESS